MKKILSNGLILPQSGYEITSKEEMSYEDGKGLITVSFFFSFNTFSISSIAGFIGGAITGFLSAMLARALPTWVWRVIDGGTGGGFAGATLGYAYGARKALLGV